MMNSPIENLTLSGPSEFTAYRSIATCDPSQHIFDDIADSDDWEWLQHADNSSSGIDHTESQLYRFIQYGNIENSLLCFEEKFWKWGRFGAGDYGVWYGALDEQTSIQETLHYRPELDKNDFKNAKDPIIQARRLFKADIDASTYADLKPYVQAHPRLIHPNDYSFCQQLGSYAVVSKLDLFLTESVRNKNGTCVPVFNSNIISDKPIQTYFNYFPLDGSEPTVLLRL